MALSPLKLKWSQQLIAGEDDEFVIETLALATTYFVQNPVFVFHNIGDETATLEITYTLELNSETDDPLQSGTYTLKVVDATVAAGDRYPYNFDGMTLDDDDNYHVTHTVKITNDGASTHTFHSILTGVTEVQTQRAASSVITNAS